MDGRLVAVDLHSTQIVQPWRRIPARIVLKIGRFPKRNFLLARQLFAYRCIVSCEFTSEERLPSLYGAWSRPPRDGNRRGIELEVARIIYRPAIILVKRLSQSLDTK